MRAAAYYGHLDIRIEDMPAPHCGPGKVLLAPQFVGICGSDLHIYFHADVAIKPDIVHPVSGEKLPIVFGHEISGIVTEVGEGVTRVAVGDKVAIQPSLYDGTCSACVKGIINCCKSWGFLGVQGSGGMADALVVEEKMAFKLPPGVDCDVGALVEPLAVAWHAVRTAGVLDATSTALVLGGGPIGCAVYLALVAKGVQNIVVSEISESRQRYVRGLGAQHVLNPTQEDVIGEVMKLSRDDGADAVFDCAGVAATIETAVAALRIHGTIVNVALWSGPAPVPMNAMTFKEGVVKTVLGYTAQDFEEVIAAMTSGSLEPESMISKKIALENLVKQGLQDLAEHGAAHCKILVDLSLK